MNVRELILLLQDYPNDMMVWHDGGGDPYCAGEIKSARVVESQGRKMMGHEDSTPDRWLELGL